MVETSFALSDIEFGPVTGLLIPRMKYGVDCTGETSIEMAGNEAIAEIIQAMGLQRKVVVGKHAIQTSVVPSSAMDPKTPEQSALLSSLSSSSSSSSSSSLSSLTQTAKKQITPDLVVLRETGGRPILALEYKVGKKEESSLLNGNVSSYFGQAFDQMCSLREVFGVRETFDIVYTYEELRITWLPEADWLATMKIEVTDVAGSKEQVQAFVQKNLHHMETQIKDTSTRCMHGTRMYRRENDGIGEKCMMMRVIASVILKALAANKVRGWREQQSLRTLPAEYCIVAKSDWDTLTWDVPEKKLRDHIMEANYDCRKLSLTANNNIWLLRHLGAGHDGSAWLAAVFSGGVVHLLVAKRFERRSGDAAKELAFWRKTYGSKGSMLAYGSVLQRAGADFILMPYFQPVEKREQTKDTLMKLKKRLESVFWGNNIAHYDVRWSNIGTLNGEVYLFDLALCEERATMQEAIETENDSPNSRDLIRAMNVN